MSLDYSRCSVADQNDEAKKARTEQLFALMRWGQAKDSELLTLVQQGICLEARDNKGETPLIKSAGQHRVILVRALIAAGADIEVGDYNGETALMRSAWYKHVASTQVLIDAGANVEARNNAGWTALMRAVWNKSNGFEAENHEALKVQALIGLGANVYTRNNLNERPIDLIKTKGWDLGIKEGEAAYAAFVETCTPPSNKAGMYQLLAFMPLVDEYAPVDYVGNLRKICVNANWDSRDQAEALLEELQADGVINASNVSDILQQTFPHTNRLLTSRSGRRGR